MPQVDFSQFHYYPALLSGAGEHIGYRELDDAQKQGIVPILELSQRANSTTPNLDFAKADIRGTSAQYPFILDLCKEPAPAPYIARSPRDPDEDRIRVEREQEAYAQYNGLLVSLLNPANGFAAWRGLAAEFPNAVPTIQFTDAANQGRQILRQAALLSRGDQSIAIRITQESDRAIYQVISQIISILESPARLLIVVDCGQGRQHLTQRAVFATDAITQVFNMVDISERPLIRAVCLSNSFMHPTHDGKQDYSNLDWRLWRGARESFPLMFGDYGAMHRIRRTDTFVPSDFRATVVLPLPESWIVYRHINANDPKGWIDGALAMVKDERFATAPRCWGTDLIRRAAAGDISGINAPRFWHAAKVNIHICSQIDFAYSNITNYGSGEGAE